MKPAPVPANEAERLAALVQLQVLDTASEEVFDLVTKVATIVMGTPIGLISLIDADRQWFKSRIGLDASETPRELAFCAHAILGTEPLVVSDSSTDPRFVDNPLATGAPHVRAYAGAPLIDKDGHAFGTLCAIDHQPRTWTPTQIEKLKALSRLVLLLLEQRKSMLDLHSLAASVAELTQNLSTSQSLLEEVTELAQVGGFRHDLKSDLTTYTTHAWTMAAAIDAAGSHNGAAGIELYHPDDRTTVTEHLTRCVMQGVSVSYEARVANRDGGYSWLKVRARPERTAKRTTGIVGAMQDITERVHNQMRLQELAAAAHAASAAKDVFLANMSHEIRTPLNGVIGLAGALARTELSEPQREMVDLILSSGETLERLLADLLDLSKIESGKFTLQDQPFDLAREVEAAAQLLRVRADDKGVRFVLAIDPEARGWFRGDAVRLRQIISNLTSNAVKFTKAGEVRVDVRLDQKHSQEPRLRLTVSDTGIGFTKDTARRLFSRFEQADGSINRRFGGTGLGLAICRGLAEAMGGSISATSQPGQGSVFTVEIPLPRCAPPAQVPHADAAPMLLAERPLRVLLAEDHPVNQRIVQLMLAPIGADVTVTADGAEALEAFALSNFDVVLMDMQMPGMDGLAATEAIRALEAAGKRRRTPIAMLSANAMGEHVAAALAAGADLHLAKPVTPATLMGGIAKALAMNQAPLQPVRAAEFG